MHKVLKFSYFLAFFLLLACGETPKSNKDVEESSEVSSKNLENNEDSEEKVILFFGNSLTAAYGLETEQGFPNLIQQRIDSLGLDYRVINSGLSGETTSGGLNRLDWVLNQKVDVFVLELGANDGLRGIPLDKTKDNLQQIIDAVRQKNENTTIILAGMQIPPNMGMDYTAKFRSMFPELADKNDVSLIPFLLEGVAGEPELNLEDGIHPTAEGQKIVANNVWKVLGPEILPVEVNTD
ncbi:GDSL-type esterase/lipase family protein [Maribacter sp. PR1]|uniref:GDSL-type esterase/lipase family protein n=1 Tax=Maribacter cobaltidurans TaxID=1178778 RepID=A0ABU7J0I5_9FLAO|nr:MULTISPECIES: GDSL-type esterase/lipase family protein [Maribacter]MDC6391145.1 GDSL-type esterase/lipase family protein [Maribacter sp. PR1]MEE1978536.1 GDSL-type esterase/lipase family protein [Maribacter cobaltidurans]